MLGKMIVEDDNGSKTVIEVDSFEHSETVYVEFDIQYGSSRQDGEAAMAMFNIRKELQEFIDLLQAAHDAPFKEYTGN